MITSQARAIHTFTSQRCRQLTGRWLAAPVLVAGLALAACGSNGGSKGGVTSESGTPPGGSTSTSAPAAPSEQNGTQGGSTPSTTETCSAERNWGMGARQGGNAMSPAPVYLVRAGQHACYDRVVFDLNGDDPVGYAVSYVPVVMADASGRPVPVTGGAALQVVIRAPILGMDTQGHQPGRTPPAVGADMVDPAAISGWASLTGVKFAGSFEGQTTFAVGVSHKHPFRVLVTGEQYYRHVVVDLAH